MSLAVTPRSASYRPRWQSIAAFVAIAVILLIAYWPTVLKQPAGSDDPLLEDSGEYQVALNVWGTVHGTGYPLYTIAGNVFVHAARLIGVDSALAPSLFSLLCGLIALAIGYRVLLRLTDQIAIAAIAMLLFGLTRATWAYDVFPKTYSLSLIFYFGLFAVAIWPGIRWQRRLWWLALIGGFAVAHHRLLAFVIPGLLIAVLPDLWRGLPHPSTASPLTERASRRALFWNSLAINGEGFRVRFWTLALCIPLAAIGFLPYIYLPARALAHGVWVYGDPSTLHGFWTEFTAVEANYLFTTAPNIGAWLNDARDTLALFPAQVTPIGTLILLVLAAYGAIRRYEARIALLCAFPLLIFVLIWPKAVVAQAVIQPIVAFLILAAALGVAEWVKQIKSRQRLIQWAIPTIGILGAVALFLWSFADLSTISASTLGVQEIAIARRIPVTQPFPDDKSIFILPWGMRYSAVAFSHYVTGETANLMIADQNANFDTLRYHELPGSGLPHYIIYTDKYTFYTLPLDWWLTQLGTDLIKSPIADIIQFETGPTGRYFVNPSPPVIVDGIVIASSSLECLKDTSAAPITLHINWGTLQRPTHSYSVFVHLIGSDASKVLATADEIAPVYGWFPTSEWPVAADVEDSVVIDRKLGAQAVQFGLYEQPQPGKFINYGTTTLKLTDFPGCDEGSN